MLRDNIKYISDSTKIVDHSTLGLIAIVRKNDSEGLKRALDTVNCKIIGSRKTKNGDNYYNLENSDGSDED